MEKLFAMSQKLKSFLLIFLSVLFNVFFWKESMGINLVLFNTITLVYLFWQNQFKPTLPQILSLIPFAFSSVGILAFSSSMAVFVNIVSFLATVGLLHTSSIKNMLFGFLATINNIFAFKREPREKVTRDKSVRRKVWFWIKISVVPALVFWLFFLLYKGANPIFDAWSTAFVQGAKELWVKFFKDISFWRIVFFFVGMIFLSGILIYVEKTRIIRFYNRLRLNKERKRSSFSGKINGLKLEMKSGMILLAAINVLLLVVNLIDISWVWFGFTIPEEFSLKQFVHEGTYLLIISILLAMGVLFYFFRGNINFLSSNGVIKKLSYVWIAQNIVLVFSVFLRNMHYIQYHGLAYKRIGVVVFLVLVLGGLVSLFFKIRDKRTTYYTIHFSSWVFAGVFAIMSIVNWDKQICKYNLSFGANGNIDAAFYLQMNPSVYPLILNNIDVVHKQIETHSGFKKRWYSVTNINDFDATLSRKIRKYQRNRKEKTWLSWTFADANTEKQLSSQNFTQK